MKTLNITIGAQVQIYRSSKHHSLASAHLLSADGKTTYGAIEEIAYTNDADTLAEAAKQFGALSTLPDAPAENEQPAAAAGKGKKTEAAQ